MRVIDGHLATQTAPNIGTQSKVDGTSFAVLMIDLDIPTNSPPQTNTLLHWLQTGLTQSSTATTVNTTTGSKNVFLFEKSQGQAAFAEYLGPSPPARIPLSHRYTQLLVDTSDATQDDLNVLQQAAASRQGFSANDILTQAGLVDKVLAGNFFNVTNPGPVTSAAAGSGSSNSTTGGKSGGTTGTGAVMKPTQTPFVPAAAGTNRASGMILAIAIVGAVFITL
ncbi:PEBP-like protein [Hypoxylon trugodes]|uniref:PEBP-like protein n=1 Tax=Hypoxylon trugodes TaxID=326681 RepID=UPI002191E1E2|nr:PEBP-like protein [Hypoxylon trugodes]KAI1391376.1 PEBP-like protein [Hypoxylon trugodes]